VVEAVVEVAVSAFLVVKHVHEDALLLVGLLHLVEAGDVFDTGFEARGQDESLVGEGLSIAEGKLVVLGVNAGDLCAALDVGPVSDLRGD
jgi:hypothetical protein